MIENVMARPNIEEVAREVVDAAIKVHRVLGPGLLESAYQACLAYELEQRKLKAACEVPMPLHYGGIDVNPGYRVDMLVEDILIVENKAVDAILPIHKAQVLTYMKLHGSTLALILNWNVRLMKDGIMRMVRNHPERK